MFFSFFFRSGAFNIPSVTSCNEGSHLSFNDVTVDCVQDPRILRVHLKASKTDPFRVGVYIYVGRTRNTLCPVTAVLNYMVARGRGSGPFFRFKDGTPLTRMKFVNKVKEASANMDSTAYPEHSFRIGAATTVAKHGISDATIKTLGRWRSSAYQLGLHQDTVGTVDCLLQPLRKHYTHSISDNVCF